MHKAQMALIFSKTVKIVIEFLLSGDATTDQLMFATYVHEFHEYVVINSTI